MKPQLFVLAAFAALAPFSSFAGLSFGRYAQELPSEVQMAIEQKLAGTCPRVFNTESMEVTGSTFDYHGNEVFEYHVQLLGRGYGSSDPHWDIDFTVVYDSHEPKVHSVDMENRGDCY